MIEQESAPPLCTVVPETVPYTPPWAGSPVAHEMRRLFLEVVNYEDNQDVDVERGTTGEVIGATPIKGTRKTFVHLRAPNGTVVRVEIEPARLDEFYGLMMPDYI